MLESVEGRVAVVTGAASGIGRALARRFAADGAHVVMADVVADSLEAAAGDLAAAGGDVLAVPTDVTDPGAVDDLARRTLDHFGAVHVVCNNAGTLAQGPVWEIGLDDWHRVMDVNFWGVLHGVHSFVPILLEQGQPAHIVNTASMAGVVTLPGIGPYVASKHAIVSLSEVLYADLAAVGAPIGVSVLCPGYVPTRLGQPDRQAPVPAAAPGQVSVDDVADDVVDAIATDRFYVFTHRGSTRRVEERMRAIVDDGAPVSVELPSP